MSLLGLAAAHMSAHVESFNRRAAGRLIATVFHRHLHRVDLQDVCITASLHQQSIDVGSSGSSGVIPSLMFPKYRLIQSCSPATVGPNSIADNLLRKLSSAIALIRQVPCCPLTANTQLSTPLTSFFLLHFHPTKHVHLRFSCLIEFESNHQNSTESNRKAPGYRRQPTVRTRLCIVCK